MAENPPIDKETLRRTPTEVVLLLHDLLERIRVLEKENAQLKQRTARKPANT